MSDGAPRPSAPADDAGSDPAFLEDSEADRDLHREPLHPRTPRGHPAALPASRTYDPPPSGFRGAPKETWEPQQRATRRPDFADRVPRTTEIALDDTAPPPPKPPPRRTGAITWEDDTSAIPKPAPPAAGGLSRGQVLVLASLSALVVVLAVAWAIKSLFGRAAVPPAAVAAAHPVDGAADTTAPTILTDERYDAAVELTKKFLASESLDDLMPFIRDPERVRPLMDEYYKREPWRPFQLREISPRDQFQLNGLMLAGMVELGDYGRRAMAFLQTPDGIKVDWESFVGFGEIPWDRLAAERPTRPVLLRVHLTADDYFNFDFPDSKTHACYRLLSQGGSHRFYGYVRRDQPVHGELLAKARPQTMIMPTVKVRFKEDGTSRDQVEITELVAGGWLVLDEKAPKDGTPVPGPATR